MNVVSLREALTCFPLEMRRGPASHIELFLIIADLQGQDVDYCGAMLGDRAASELLKDLEHGYGLVTKGDDDRY